MKFLAGLLAGLSFYTYMASRGMPALYVVILGLAFVRRRTTPQ